jgi:hypothetical protein
VVKATLIASTTLATIMTRSELVDMDGTGLAMAKTLETSGYFSYFCSFDNVEEFRRSNLVLYRILQPSTGRVVGSKPQRSLLCSLLLR